MIRNSRLPMITENGIDMVIGIRKGTLGVTQISLTPAALSA